MAPLREPSTFCIRSFEANPQLVPLLRAGAALPGAEPAASSVVAPNVRYIDGALSNRSGVDLPREVVTYARNRWGSTATTLTFKDIHPSQPPLLSSATVRGASYDVRDVLRAALQRNASSLIALKLDVEGDEFWMLDQLSREPQLLCNVSYLFVEFHNLPGAPHTHPSHASPAPLTRTPRAPHPPPSRASHAPLRASPAPLAPLVRPRPGGGATPGLGSRGRQARQSEQVRTERRHV